MRKSFCYLIAIFCFWSIPLNAHISTPPPQASKSYVCPPCGCTEDGIVYGFPDTCSACGMERIVQPAGTKEKISSILAPTYRHSSEFQFFPKLIYPAFFTALFFGLLSLLAARGRRVLNPFLSLIILVIALYSFKFQLYGQSYGFFNTSRVIFTPISFIVILGPLLYFYSQSILKTSFRFKRKFALHFLPGVLVFLWYIFAGFSGGSSQRVLLHSPYEVRISHIEQIIAIVLGIGYLSASFISFWKWRRSHALRNYTFSGWLFRFHVGFFILFVLWGALIFVNYFIYQWGVATGSYFVLWIGMALFIYWIYLEILNNPKFFLINRHLKISNGHVALSKQELRNFKSRLESLMLNEKLYLNPKLSLSDLATAMDTNPKYLSMILNNELRKNFYEFVNSYRIEEVKQLLRNPLYTHLTIEAVAQLAGFQSKSSFNALFKKHTSMTPRDFLRSISWE